MLPLLLLHMHSFCHGLLHPSGALVNTRNCAQQQPPCLPSCPSSCSSSARCRPAFSSAVAAWRALSASRCCCCCWRLLPSHAAFFRSPECLFSQKVLIYLRRKFYILHDTRLQLHALLLLCRRRCRAAAEPLPSNPSGLARLDSTHLHLSWQRAMSGRTGAEGEQPSMLQQQHKV